LLVVYTKKGNSLSQGNEMDQEKILIVDDSRLSRMMIKGFTLATIPDCSVIEAENGEDALNKCQDQEITRMTIDYNMPGMDGLTLCSELRKKYPHANMALLTANIQDSVKERTEALGISFIQKPVTEEKIAIFMGN